MPQNLKEEALFTGIMAGLMVLVMTIYNIFLAIGFNQNLPQQVLTGYPIALLVALVLDVLLVGPIAKFLAFKVIFKNGLPTPLIKLGLTISIIMVLGMVSLMSVFGLIESNGIANITWSTYLITWIRNFVVALPLQLLLVGPFARFILARVQGNK